MLKPMYRNKPVVPCICDSFDHANEGIPQRKPVTQLPIPKRKFPNMFSGCKLHICGLKYYDSLFKSARCELRSNMCMRAPTFAALSVLN